MASYLQQILEINNVSRSLAGSTTNSSSTTDQGFSMTSLPNLLAILPLLFTSAALRDWFKLIIIGGFFEACRRFLTKSYSDILDSFRIEAVFDEQDPTYAWMMAWLSKQPSWQNVRAVEVAVNYDRNDSHSIMLDSEEEGLSRFGDRVPRKVIYTPSPSRTYSIWYKRRYMSVTRVQEESRWGKSNSLQINIFSRNAGILKDLIQEARKEFIDSQDNKLSVFTSDVNNNWRVIGSRPKRSLQSIVLDPGMKELLLEDAKDFLASREWYSERGIPFRRGYLLYGAPGCGKTSLIHSIAGELDLDVYIVSLSRAGLDDNALNTLITELPERCVALMEDIDAALTRGLNRDIVATTTTEDKSDEPGSPKEKNEYGPSAVHTGSRVSLSGLLNSLDGIGAAEGRILFATTNKYSSLDPALTRPGRMDLHIEFRLASKPQARELFWHFYRPMKNLNDVHVHDQPEVKVKADPNDHDHDQSLPSDAESEEKKAMVTTTVVGDIHQHARFSDEVIRSLASQFADLIPERRLSMAALQGFLMTYKTRPFVAVEKAPEWLERELAK